MGIKIGKFEITNQPTVYTRKPASITRYYGFSIDFCDKTTWYASATQVTNETVGTGDGVQTSFNLNHGTNAVTNEAIIDVTHGKITEEEPRLQDVAKEGDYRLKIYFDSVLQTEREFGETTGGVWEANYSTGVITFYTAPSVGVAITADYWYVAANVGPIMKVSPPAGKKYSIDDAELQFAGVTDMTDTLVQSIYVGGFPYGDSVLYKRVRDFINYTFGSFPTIPAIAPGTERGTNNQTILLRWDFKSSIELLSSLGMEFRISSKHNRQPLTGEYATVVLYALEEDE